MILTLDYDVNNKEIKTNNRASRWGYIIVANNIFCTIVEIGSFTEVTEKRFISQSAISKQIQSLEKELGIKLIKRENC